MSSDMNGFPQQVQTFIKTDPSTRATSFENTPEILGNTTVNTNGENFQAYRLGRYAIDFQSFRSAASQSASGDHAICIGTGNVSSGTSSIAIGRLNNSSGANSAFCIGLNNTSSATSSGSIGSGNNSAAASALCYGLNNTASASAALAIGSSCLASGINSTSMGLQSTTSGVLGRHAYSSGVFASVGDCQTSTFITRGATTNATPKVLTTDAGTATASNTVVLLDNSTFSFSGQITVKETATGQASAWNIEGMITRVANAAATTLVASTVTAISNATAIPGPALTANTTLGGLAVTCTGVAATNLRWTCNINTTEIVYV